MSFEVRITSDHNKNRLGVTHNGYQWVSISELTLDEIRQIEEACHNYLAAQHSAQADGDYWRCKNCGRRNDIGTIECAGCG